MMKTLLKIWPMPVFRFVRPFLDLVYRAVLQFLRFWLNTDWGTKLLTSPVLILSFLFLGMYVFLFGCKV